MTELEKRCYILEEENMIYKEDLKNLREIVEKLKCENCKMKAELKILRNKSLDYRHFNTDGEEAVEELLEILNKDDKLTIVKRRNGNYYRLYNKFGGNIFVIENYNCGRAQKGLLTTPEPRKIIFQINLNLINIQKIGNIMEKQKKENNMILEINQYQKF